MLYQPLPLVLRHRRLSRRVPISSNLGSGHGLGLCQGKSYTLRMPGNFIHLRTMAGDVLIG
ncbi:hypothetical protein ES702_02866 [subsurface metagenome]